MTEIYIHDVCVPSRQLTSETILSQTWYSLRHVVRFQHGREYTCADHCELPSDNKDTMLANRYADSLCIYVEAHLLRLLLWWVCLTWVRVSKAVYCFAIFLTTFQTSGRLQTILAYVCPLKRIFFGSPDALLRQPYHLRGCLWKTRLLIRVRTYERLFHILKQTFPIR